MSGPLPKTRAKALASGSKYYRTGLPCKRGHLDKRYAGGKCVSCAKEDHELTKSSRSAYFAAYNARYRIANLKRLRLAGRINGRKRMEKNGAHVRALARTTRKRNIESVRAFDRSRSRARHIANPLKGRIDASIRRARKNGAPGRYTARDIECLLDKQKCRCVYCPKSLAGGYHIDHKRPLSRGGSNWPRNIQLTCDPCNLSKHDKTHTEFMRYKAELERVAA